MRAKRKVRHAGSPATLSIALAVISPGVDGQPTPASSVERPRGDALAVLLRFSGKRTLSRLNAFDLVVTVALGSILATVLLSKSVALAEGVPALGRLIVLQYAIAWLSVRSPGFQTLIKAEPSLLPHRGRFLQGAMQAERITHEEILAALRASGAADGREIAAVVLETDCITPDPGTTGATPTLDTARRLDHAPA